MVVARCGFTENPERAADLHSVFEALRDLESGARELFDACGVAAQKSDLGETRVHLGKDVALRERVHANSTRVLQIVLGGVEVTETKSPLSQELQCERLFAPVSAVSRNLQNLMEMRSGRRELTPPQLEDAQRYVGPDDPQGRLGLLGDRERARQVPG